MKYKAIISDLDGTLFNKDHRTSQYTRDVLKKALEKGYKIIIATGRHHIDLNDIVKQEINLPLYKVASNGSRAYDINDNIIHNVTLSEDTAKKILNTCFDKDVLVHLYQGDKWYCNAFDEISASQQQASRFMFEIIDFNNIKDFSDVIKVCYISRNENLLSEVNKKMSPLLKEDVNTFFTLPICYEIVSKNADKSKAISKILEIEGILPEETIAFGDGMNDYNMLKQAGKGLVMGNALNELKQKLPHCQVIGKNDDNSVAKYIEQNLL